MAVQESGPRFIRDHFVGRVREREEQRDRRERAFLIVAALFIFTNSIAYSLALDDTLRWNHLWVPIVWFGVTLCGHLLISRYKADRDPFLFPVFAFLAGWSLLLQDRLAPNFLSRQVLWFLMGTVAILLVAILPKTLAPLQRYRYLLLFGGLALIGLTLLFGVNPSGSGAALWLPIPIPIWGKVYLQPSELLKILLVIFLASYFTEQEPLYHYRKQQTRRNNQAGMDRLMESIRNQVPFLGPLLLMWGFTIILLVWQQDLGAAALFFLVFIALLYLATGSVAYVVIGIFLLVMAGAGLYFVFDTVVTPRIISWIDPWPHASTFGYQIVQSLMAQAAGGVIGQGIGQGFPDYIPVVHSDFVLAAIAEEWGLIGSLAVIACFALLAQRGLRIALDSTLGSQSNLFHAYLAAGFSVVFTIQAFLIIGGVTKLLPLTGITLPFISYGGSSFLVSSIMIGLLVFLSATNNNRVIPLPTPFHGAIKQEFSQRIVKLGATILISFMALAIGMAYWAVVRSDTLLAREDNPRLIEIEQLVQRGRIVDRNDIVLAETSATSEGLNRNYPVQDSGPAVGYYDIRYGTAGIEQTLDPILRGNGDVDEWQQAWRRLLHIPAYGQDVQLTLDAELQILATELMAQQTGGLVLLELSEFDRANVLAMVSQPKYDPNGLAERFEELSASQPGPLFNRAAQGQYQPGLMLQPLILAAGSDDAWLRLDEPIRELSRPVTIDGHVVRCVTRPANDAGQEFFWADAIDLSCPGPLYELGEQIGTAGLESVLERFGLTDAPDFVLPVAPSPPPIAIVSPGQAAIGQEQLTVTPLQLALAYSALAGDGHIRQPVLVKAIHDGSTGWVNVSSNSEGASTRAISEETAAAVREFLSGDPSTLGATAAVLSGPTGDRDVWFAGMAPATTPRYIVALVLEDGNDPKVAEGIGQSILNATISRP
jgi:peptidoglycan glycosyltransferase